MRRARRSTRAARTARPDSSAWKRQTSSAETEESTTAFTPNPINDRLPVAAAVTTAAPPTRTFQATVAAHSATARLTGEPARPVTACRSGGTESLDFPIQSAHGIQLDRRAYTPTAPPLCRGHTGL